MAKARIDYCKRQLFSLPTDLLPLIFSFLSPKELCCLDSSILNHTDRPIFLSALIQRFTKKSIFHFHKSIDEYFTSISIIHEKEPSIDSYASWYRCRRIPVTTLTLFNTSCPPEMISMNINYLTNIKFVNICLGNEDVVALGRCLNLKNLFLLHVFSLVDGERSIFQNLSPSLEDLGLCNFSLSRVDFEAIPRSFPSLKSLELSSMEGVGDEELRILVEHFPFLRSLRLCYLDITEESVKMLRNHRPRISSIGLRSCGTVSDESVLSILREFTIPTLLNSRDEDLQLSALENINHSLINTYRSYPEINDHFFHSSLLARLADLLTVCRLRFLILNLLTRLTFHDSHDRVADAGIVPVLIRHFVLFDERQREIALEVLHGLSSDHSCQRHLLSSGVLSIFHPRLIFPFVRIIAPSFSDLFLG
jgi:hypothetical protein